MARLSNDPLDKARATLKSRYHEGARAHYREALAVQPGNWAIMEEVASAFLMMTEDHARAIEMADQGLPETRSRRDCGRPEARHFWLWTASLMHGSHWNILHSLRRHFRRHGWHWPSLNTAKQPFCSA